jgi:hypothetical protein
MEKRINFSSVLRFEAVKTCKPIKTIKKSNPKATTLIFLTKPRLLICIASTFGVSDILEVLFFQTARKSIGQQLQPK